MVLALGLPLPDNDPAAVELVLARGEFVEVPKGVKETCVLGVEQPLALEVPLCVPQPTLCVALRRALALAVRLAVTLGGLEGVSSKEIVAGGEKVAALLAVPLFEPIPGLLLTQAVVVIVELPEATGDKEGRADSEGSADIDPTLVADADGDTLAVMIGVRLAVPQLLPLEMVDALGTDETLAEALMLPPPL